MRDQLVHYAHEGIDVTVETLDEYGAERLQSARWSPFMSTSQPATRGRTSAAALPWE